MCEVSASIAVGEVLVLRGHSARCLVLGAWCSVLGQSGGLEVGVKRLVSGFLLL